GMVYIAPGRFLYGCSEDERFRQVLGSDPPHEVRTSAYLIRRTETTYADWLDFLHALPAPDRETRRPRIDNRFGALDLVPVANGKWELLLQPRGQPYRALQGESLHYTDRALRADQDWLNFPVAGISWDDAHAYLAWLRQSGRLPGA